MKLTDICRESIPVIEFNEPLSTLANEAKEVLGYSVLKEEEGKEDQRPTLLRKLAALQIEILRTVDVQKYQREILIEHTHAKLQEWIANTSTSQTQFWGPGWRKEEIGAYKLPVPEFVLNKAIQIKREIPDARIFIESLQDFPDPFLVIATKHPQYECLNEEEYYVEVWEEPKFEGRIR